MSRLRPVGAALILLFAALSCSSSLEPRSGVTVLVLNGTCGQGSCTSLEVFAFPSNQPRTPGGFWSLDLGTMTGPETCIAIPDTATFLVIGVNADRTADTTKYRWTNAMPLALTATIPEFTSVALAPSTPLFVPAKAVGWRVTLPGRSQVVGDSTCTL